MHYLIYKITNKLNGKFYVGKHKTDNVDDDYFGSGLLLRRAVEKHGKENFDFEILYIGQTNEEISEMEKYYINTYDCRNPKVGYNIRPGGEGGDTWSALSPEERLIRSKKQSEAQSKKYTKKTNINFCGYPPQEKENTNKK